MKTFNILFYLAFCCFLCSKVLSQPVAAANESLGQTVDCTDVRINYSDDSTLTREERIRLMDKALFESLNKFEFCQAAKKNSAAAGNTAESGGGTSGTDAVVGNSEGEKGGETVGKAPVNSVASSSMSGTDVAKELPPAEGLEAMQPGASQNAQDINEAGGKRRGNRPLPNGKLPEDIPSAKNDDALAAQIRYAAENEPDPAKSKRLWNEYRKYKGLSPK